MSDFEVDIQRWADEAEGKVGAFVKNFTLRMTAEIKLGTPVLTGRLRSSIQPQGFTSWEPGQPITISTNVEYARRIEYGFVGKDSLGRNYNQPGHHMFAMAIAKAPEIADAALHDVQNGTSFGATIVEGAAVGAAEGAADAAIMSALFPAADVVTVPVGAILGAVVGGGEAALQGPGGSVPLGAGAGALEGLIIGGPLGAVGNAALGAAEGAGEAGILNATDDEDSQP